jgi:hypothetical protein
MAGTGIELRWPEWNRFTVSEWPNIARWPRLIFLSATVSFAIEVGGSNLTPLKPMNDNLVRMLPPPEQSWAAGFRHRAKTFAPIVAIALFVAGFAASTDLQAATYVRVNIGGRPYYGYPYRYHGYYHYRGDRYRYRYYRYGRWHYY